MHLSHLKADFFLAPFATGRGWEFDALPRLFRVLAGTAATHLTPLVFSNLVADRGGRCLWDMAGGTRVFDHEGSCIAEITAGEDFSIASLTKQAGIIDLRE